MFSDRSPAFFKRILVCTCAFQDLADYTRGSWEEIRQSKSYSHWSMYFIRALLNNWGIGIIRVSRASISSKEGCQLELEWWSRNCSCCACSSFLILYGARCRGIGKCCMSFNWLCIPWYWHWSAIEQPLLRSPRSWDPGQILTYPLWWWCLPCIWLMLPDQARRKMIVPYESKQFQAQLKIITLCDR